MHDGPLCLIRFFRIVTIRKSRLNQLRLSRVINTQFITPGKTAYHEDVRRHPRRSARADCRCTAPCFLGLRMPPRKPKKNKCFVHLTLYKRSGSSAAPAQLHADVCGAGPTACATCGLDYVLWGFGARRRSAADASATIYPPADVPASYRRQVPAHRGGAAAPAPSCLTQPGMAPVLNLAVHRLG